jgi:argininosuccinate lyase
LKKKKKLWSGAFQLATNADVETFTSSLSFDKALFQEDISCSIAHANMLNKQKIIPQDKAKKIIDGLQIILLKIEQGSFEFNTDNEDIHMSIESSLFELIGDDAGYLHTGRSRNDLIATDLRIYSRVATKEILNQLIAFRETLVELATQERLTIFPGYTHMQNAQPILLAHHFLAYEEMMKRDTDRFIELTNRINIMPLGSGALAGSGYDFDRPYLAKQLNFDKISKNSMDAVSDRDFVFDINSASAICMVHLSRLAEEIILWASSEFNLISIHDDFATGSSIMPQKKNPDVAELVRGKSARVIGNLMQILTLLKGLPLTYNRDLQEDKESLFDSIDTMINCLSITNGLLNSITINKIHAEKLAVQGYALATDIADYLTKKGVPFRKSHEIVGKIVLHCSNNNIQFSELSLEEYKNFNINFESDILNLDALTSINNRDLPGGTAVNQIELSIREASHQLKQDIQKIK